MSESVPRGETLSADFETSPPEHFMRSRHDGWSPEKMRIFLEALAAHRTVGRAAAACDMSRESAYRLRHRNGGFRIAWDAAQRLARTLLAETVVSRALEGYTETWVRDGVVSERRRYDNRLAMSVLTHLEKKAGRESDVDPMVDTVCDHFGEFVDEVCRGGRNAADFLARRHDLNWYRRSKAILHGEAGPVDTYVHRSNEQQGRAMHEEYATMEAMGEELSPEQADFLASWRQAEKQSQTRA